VSKIHIHKPIKISDEVEKKIVDMAWQPKTQGNAMDYPFQHGLSLRVLAGYVSKEINLVNSISHAEIRNIPLKHGDKVQAVKYHTGKQPRS